MKIKSSTTLPERLITAGIWFLCSIIFFGILLLLFKMVGPGFKSIRWDFIFTEPLNSGRGGGVFPILTSTLLILLICLAVSVPLGVATAVYLSEFTIQKNWMGRQIRRSLDILAGVPSIVFGLFGNALFCKYWGLGFSILSGGLTLSLMVLPILVRSVEIGLRSVPEHYKLSGSALALSKSTMLFQITLPYAAPAVTVGLILGIGRALAETAALIFTSGYVDRMPSSLMDSGRALSVHIYDLSMNVPGGEPNAYKSIFVIMLALFLINSLAMLLTNIFLTRKVKEL